MKALATFFAVAFGFSWAVAAVAWATNPAPPARVALYVVFMWGPALGALVAQRVVVGDAVFAPLGVVVKPNRWWLVAWLAPVAFSLVTALVGALAPGVETASPAEALVARLSDVMTTPEQLAQLEQARTTLATVPPPALVLAMLLQALVAAISVNLVATFGEELGWRGFLAVRLAHMGFWSKSLVVGVIWGFWHAPIILMGHNYPQHPVAGVFMMVVFTTLLAGPFQWVREKGDSVVAACVVHGSVNASAGFAVLFLKGGSDLVVGVTGVAGFVVLAVVNVALAMARRP